MSVLQRKELEESPLADLHAIASEIGIERYRALRQAELVKAILAAQGGEAAADRRPRPGADRGRGIAAGRNATGAGYQTTHRCWWSDARIRD